LDLSPTHSPRIPFPWFEDCEIAVENVSFEESSENDNLSLGKQQLQQQNLIMIIEERLSILEELQDSAQQVYRDTTWNNCCDSDYSAPVSFTLIYLSKPELKST
jgi:hypothetical protein